MRFHNNPFDNKAPWNIKWVDFINQTVFNIWYHNRYCLYLYAVSFYQRFGANRTMISMLINSDNNKLTGHFTCVYNMFFKSKLHLRHTLENTIHNLQRFGWYSFIKLLMHNLFHLYVIRFVRVRCRFKCTASRSDNCTSLLCIDLWHQTCRDNIHLAEALSKKFNPNTVVDTPL